MSTYTIIMITEGEMQESTFYQRQIILKDVGFEGQQKLKKACVLVVGAGGLGHPVASYLAAAGVGHLQICDFDRVEATNLNRQILFKPNDVGEFKAEVLAGRIKKQNPFINVTVINNKLNASNIKSHLDNIDIIVDCCDNFATKFLLHDSAYLLKKDLVQASIYQLEGQLQTFAFKSYKNNKGCLRCLWPEVPREGCVGNCAQAGVIGAVAGVLGSLQAMEVIKLILGIGEQSVNLTRTFDLTNFELSSLKWKEKENCTLCGDDPSITDLWESEYDSSRPYDIEEINLDKYHYVDLREEDERLLHPLQIETRHLPFSKYDQWSREISSNDKFVFFCLKGARSSEVVHRLRSKGMKKCFNLKGGVCKNPLLLKEYTHD